MPIDGAITRKFMRPSVRMYSSEFVDSSTLLRRAASLPFFTRLRRASHLSLCGHCAAGAARTAKLARRAKGRSPELRNMAQRKATPHSRLTHSPCAPRARACSGVRRQSIRGLASNWPTSCGPSFGQFLRSPAARDGTLLARIVRAKIKAPHPPCRAPSPAEREKEMPVQTQSMRKSAPSWLRTRGHGCPR